MTQFQRDKVKEALQKSGIANPSYVNGEFILYRSGGRHLCLKEQNPLLVFYGPQYEIMRIWADKVISAFAQASFQDWECCRRNTPAPKRDSAVWFQFKNRNLQGDWSDHIDSVVKVAVALYNKLNEEGILSDSFDATKYNDVNNVGHQGVVAMNEKTKEAFRIWMNGNGIQEGAGKQYVGYMERYIAQGRCLNVLDDQGNPVDNLDVLVKDLSAKRDDWNTFSQNIQGADNSKAQYKVALGKFIDFAKSVRDGVPPHDPTNQEGRQEEPKEMKSRNLIMFGAPGTGKSHKLEEKRKVFGDRYERVTFYPTYSYAQFVGTYKPVMQVVEAAMKSDGLSDDELSNLLKEDYNNAGGGSEKTKTAAVLLFAEKYYESLSKTSIPQIIKKAGLPESSYTAWLSTGMALARARAHNLAGKKESTIAYEFVPGPFLRVLVKALNDSQNDYCLVIEEINRANAAAVFGDVFQLLDRVVKDDADKNVKKDTSEYAIAASEDVKRYLGEALTDAGKNALLELTGSMDNLKMPANMYIWATMNSADQGVFPMDTAFKRRWAFEYLGLNEGAGEDGEGDWKIGTKDAKFDYKWEDFRRYMNRLLALAKVNEDKLMGPFFMKKPVNNIIDKNEFESKVLMYLWEDAGKMCRRQLFGEITTYSELIDEWEEKGIEIFSSALREKDTIKDKGNNFRNAKTLFSKLVQHAAEGQGAN